MNKKIIFGGLIGLLLIIIGGVYFFVYSKSPQGVATGNSLDWCKSKELSASIANSSPDPDPIPKENVAGLVQEVISYAQLASQRAEKQGVSISQSEFCALQIVETNATVKYTEEYSKTDMSLPPKLPPVSVVELTKYIGNDRATVVLGYQNQEADSSNKDVSAKAIIASASFGIHSCILQKENRILEPKSNQVLCQHGATPQSIEMWGDLDGIGGKWGGCDFQVTRNTDGVISDVHYCASLPSGIQAVCTLNRCSYEGQ